MKLFLLPILLAYIAYASAQATTMGMSITGGSYNFGYNTGDAGGHTRAESGSGNTVQGSYSYVDPNGDLRTVRYTAGPGGYQPSGDIGVDRKTAAAAAALAAAAPRAPVAAPVHNPAPASQWYNPGPYGGQANVIMSNNGVGVAHYAARW